MFLARMIELDPQISNSSCCPFEEAILSWLEGEQALKGILC